MIWIHSKEITAEILMSRILVGRFSYKNYVNSILGIVFLLLFRANYWKAPGSASLLFSHHASASVRNINRYHICLWKLVWKEIEILWLWSKQNACICNKIPGFCIGVLKAVWLFLINSIRNMDWCNLELNLRKFWLVRGQEWTSSSFITMETSNWKSEQTVCTVRVYLPE